MKIKNMLLNHEQRVRAVVLMRDYLNAPVGSQGQTPVQRYADLDEQRAKLITEQLKPLVENYLRGNVKLEEFKSKIDGINKRNEFWGFKGIKGQMFFNMLINSASDLVECDQELKVAIALPENEEIAKTRIRNFVSYVKRVGDAHVESGESKQSRPKVGSVLFFLSYFWQVQDNRKWPIYYTNAVNVLIDANLWQPKNDPANDYIEFKQLHEELIELFTKESGDTFNMYWVEHVFWIEGGNPYSGVQTTPDEITTTSIKIPVKKESNLDLKRLPESYVPPVISVLPLLANNAAGYDEVARNSGTSIARAFEKCINTAFTILGFEATLLGQGGGRVPDGIALNIDDSYGILWDAKARADSYNMGTDDRTIREYINTQSRDLKRRRSLRNIF